MVSHGAGLSSVLIKASGAEYLVLLKTTVSLPVGLEYVVGMVGWSASLRRTASGVKAWCDKRAAWIAFSAATRRWKTASTGWNGAGSSARKTPRVRSILSFRLVNLNSIE